MFSKCFLLLTFMLFMLLVHSITCVGETNTIQPSKSAGSSKLVIKRRILSPVISRNVPKENPDSTDTLRVDAPLQASPAVDGSEVRGSKLTGRRKRATPTRSQSIKKKTSIPKSDVPNSIRRPRSQPVLDKENPEDNISEASESYTEDMTPKQPLHAKPGKIDIGSEIKDNKRRPRIAKSTTSTTSRPQNKPILLPSEMPLEFSSPNTNGNEMQNDVDKPQFVESRPNKKEKNTSAQNESIPPYYEHEPNDDWISFGGLTSTLVSGGKQPDKIFNFNDFSPDDEREATDGFGYTEDQENMDEFNQSSEESVVFSIFKIIINSLVDMFFAMKNVLQKPIQY